MSRKIKTTENVQECFDEHSFAISFNYTDTIKLYTDNYYYAKSNSFKGHKAPFDYSNVKEIIVMGHGLESDLNYLTETFEKVPQIQKVILYTYDEEAMYEKERKISILKKYRE